MSYQVLARKYRPSTFDEVLGQEGPVRTLQNAVREGRVAPAYIFSGTRGVGKTTVARLLAKALNCENGPTPEPCGTCVPCTEIAEARCLDVFEIDAASNTGVDNVRELRESIQYAPSRDRYKVFIIDEAHMLSTAAWNALLKTLEEPPPHAVFIFATTEPGKILDTIKSRSQHFDFRTIPREILETHIERLAGEEGLEPGPGVVPLVARAAAGSVRDGLSILDQLVSFSGPSPTADQAREVLGLVAEELIDGFLGAVADQDPGKTLDIVGELAGAGHDLRAFCADLIETVRMVVLWHALADAKKVLELDGEEAGRAEALAERFRLDEAVRLFSFLEGLERDLRQTAREKHLVEIAAVKMTRLVGLVPLEELVGGLLGDDAAKVKPARSRPRKNTEPSSTRGGGKGGGARREASPAPAAPEAEAAPAGGAPAGDTAAPGTRSAIERIRAAVKGGGKSKSGGGAEASADDVPESTGPATRKSARPHPGTGASGTGETTPPTRGETSSAPSGGPPGWDAEDPGPGDHDLRGTGGTVVSGDLSAPKTAPGTVGAAAVAVAPTPETDPAVAPAAPDDLHDVLVAAVKRRKEILGAYLGHAVIERNNGAIEMTFAPGGEMWAGRLKTRGAQKVLREAIQEVAGEELKTVIRMGERKSAGERRETSAERHRRLRDEAMSDPLVRHAMDKFNARVVEARPRGKSEER